MIAIVALLFLCFIIVLVYVTIRLDSGSRNKKNEEKATVADNSSSLMKAKHCLLCQGELVKPNKLISKQLQRKDDSIIYLYGCRNCAHNDTPKICPVCKRKLGAKEYLIGRMWMREKTKKNHLHIAGCTHCARIKITQ